MQIAAVPVIKDLVLAGCGHAHVAVLRSLGMTPLPGLRVTIVTKEIDTPYSGMLPGHVAGHYSHDDIHIDTAKLAAFAGARLFHDEVIGLDLDARRVLCRRRPPVPFDLLSLDIGAAPTTHRVPGADRHALAVKPIGAFLERWSELEARLLIRAGAARIAVVGGGAGGIELLLAMRHRLRALWAENGRDPELLGFLAVGRGSSILPGFGSGARRRLSAVLDAQKVERITGRSVVAVEPGRLFLDDGTLVPADEVLWVTEAGAAPWLRHTGLALDGDGFVLVDDTLRSASHPFVFAAGDVAALASRPLPKSGVYAVRQGAPLAANLRRTLTGRKLRRYRPQRAALGLISTGGRHAVAARGGWSAQGAWAWHWKDWIDRRFMRRYQALPAMGERAAPRGLPVIADAAERAQLETHPMRCGGCGAKVGRRVLERVLAGLARPAVGHDGTGGIALGLDAGDDAAAILVPPGMTLVQSVDQFRALVDDPYLFGKIAAQHCLGDLYAMGAEPHSALAVALLPFGLEAKVEADLAMLMAGAVEVLRDAGATLIGGHTGEAAELALGFSVNGLASPDRLVRKAGMRAGDLLLLTKPLGTGTLMAAAMRGSARGRWLQAALASMAQSSAHAARCMHRFGASAATDVTGFGLLGHALELARASACDIELALDALPALDGARETLAAGIVSSLRPANSELGRALERTEVDARHGAFELLFDPQTAGGLLMAVPEQRAAACLDALRQGGCRRAAIIGRAVSAGPSHPMIRLVGAAPAPPAGLSREPRLAARAVP